MKYETALEVAEKAVAMLKKGEMSEHEVICHVAALDLALATIAKRNNITLRENQ